ncbi:hypothetical protein MBLNU457_3283t1 [Dothideomycetes sp. NU457]
MSDTHGPATIPDGNEVNGSPALDETVDDAEQGNRSLPSKTPDVKLVVDDAEKGSQSFPSDTPNVKEGHSPGLEDHNGSAHNDGINTASMLAKKELGDSALQGSDGSSAIDPWDNLARLNHRIAKAEVRYNEHGERIRNPGDVWIDENGVQCSISWDLPLGLVWADEIGGGISGGVYHLDAVVKSPRPLHERDIAIERRIYERLGRHEGILRYYGAEDKCIILEYASNGSIRDYYEYDKKDATIPLAMKLKWVEEVVETVAFMLSKGVFHTDLTCNNVLLDKHFRTKVADFAGSVIDGSKHLVMPGDRFRLPHSGYEPQEITVGFEIFSLGSMFYEIMAEREPRADLEDDDVEEAFAAGDFGETESLPAFGAIIRKCWTQQYDGIEELLSDVKDEVKIKSFQSESLPAPIPCSLSTFVLGAALLLVPLLLTGH